MPSIRPKNTTDLMNWVDKDETKRLIKFVSRTVKTDITKNYDCWWCTLLIDGNPIGCPLSCKDGVYYTDGVFCSVNCVKAYLLEYCQNDPVYQNSLVLLSFMLRDMNPSAELPITITPSPPWKSLIQKGGYLTVEQYKKELGNILYTHRGIIKQHPITILSTEEHVY